ncbi:MAG: VWA domain-containing protein, partial [Planctomycetota bacterium]
MRRLPVYLVLDTSGSMMGEPIEQVKNGVQMLISALRQDPYALETAYLSVISFNTNASQLVPLTELTSFQAPDLQASGITELGGALKLTAECASREVEKTTAESKGDWRPMVFLMTDGMPTDDWKSGLSKFKEERWGIVVGCAIGKNDSSVNGVLNEICGEAVVQLDTADSGAIAAFFKWVSASISMGSQKVE